MSGMTASQGMNRTKAKKVRHEQQLLDAAFSLFLEHGVERTTVEQITNAAGLAKGTFYLYFRDKQDLAGRVIQFWAENLCNEAREQFNLTGGDGGALVEQVTGVIIDALACDDRLIRFIYQNLTFELFGQIAGGEAAGILDALIALLEQGGVKMRQPRIAVFMIMQLIAGVCYQAVSFEGTLPVAELRPYLLGAVKSLIATL